MIVDLACVGAVVYLAIKGVREPAVWSILSGLMIGRFGVSHSKTMERSSRNGGGGGDGGGWSGRSREFSSTSMPPTEERDPRSFPRPIPREDPPLTPPRRARSSASAIASAGARSRLLAWIDRRRARDDGYAPRTPWWTRRAVSVPLTGLRVDAVGLAVLVVLVVALAATLATAGRSVG